MVRSLDPKLSGSGLLFSTDPHGLSGRLKLFILGIFFAVYRYSQEGKTRNTSVLSTMVLLIRDFGKYFALRVQGSK